MINFSSTQRMSHATLNMLDSPRVQKLNSVKIKQKDNNDVDEPSDPNNPFIIKDLDTGEVKTLIFN